MTPESPNFEVNSGYSSRPVQYSNGRPLLESPDIQSNAFGITWGHTRTWSGRDAASDNGNGWAVEELPYLVIEQNLVYDAHGAILAVMAGGNAVAEFTKGYNTAAWTPRYGAKDKLEYTAGTTVGTDRVPGEFHWTDPSGNVTSFYDVPRSKDGPNLSSATSFEANTGVPFYDQAVTNQWADGTYNVDPSSGTDGTSHPYRYGAFKGYTDASHTMTVTANYQHEQPPTSIAVNFVAPSPYSQSYFLLTLGASTIASARLQVGDGITTSGTTDYNGVGYIYSIDHDNVLIAMQSSFGDHGDQSGSISFTTRHPETDAILSSVVRTDGSTYERFKYDYTLENSTHDLTLTNSNGASAPVISKVTLARSPDGVWDDDSTTDTNNDKVIQSASYEYYTGTESDDTKLFGRFGDLKLVTIRDHQHVSTGEITQQKYYRYNKLYGQAQGNFLGRGPTNVLATTGGSDTTFPVQGTTDVVVSSGLQAVFEGPAFARLAAGVGSGYQTAANSSVDPYADNVFAYQRVDPTDSSYPNYWDYDTRYRVIQEVAANSGCSTCSGGFGTFRFEYAARAGGRTTAGNYDSYNYSPTYPASGALSYSGTTATVPTFQGNTNYTVSVGDAVTVSGSGASPFFGTFIVTAVGVNTLSYEMASTPTASPSGAVQVADLSFRNTWVTRTTEWLPDSTSDTWDDNDENIVYTNGLGEVMLAVLIDRNSTTSTGDDQSYLTYYHYDVNGRRTDVASSSAVTGYSESKHDLVDWYNPSSAYLSATSGLITHTEYGDAVLNAGTLATTTTAGDVDGYVKSTSLYHGRADSTPKLQESWTYIKHSYAGADVYIVASDTTYFEFDSTHSGDDASTTTYAYDWFPDGSSVGTNRVASIVTTMPSVAAGHHGSGSSPTITSVFDAFGRPTWTKDAQGFINHFEYDETGGLKTQLIDVDTAAVSGEPTGWTTPTGGGANLLSTAEFDGLGRITKSVDPKLNVTYTVYNDAAHEVRVYRGWDATTGLPTGPIAVSRADWPLQYNESVTATVTPTTTGSSGSYVPTGQETSFTTIHSLSRSLINTAGQIVETDRYFSLNGLTYSASDLRLGDTYTSGVLTHSGASNDSGASGTYYHATFTDYDGRGRLKRVMSPSGTIARYLYDARGNLTSTWVGTDDTPAASGVYWSPAYQGSHSDVNLTRTETRSYDADGNLVQRTQMPDGDERVTGMYYDWRDRLVATKSGDQGGSGEGSGIQRQIAFSVLDNAGHILSTSTFDGDGVSITSTDTPPSSTYLRTETDASYDERGRLYESRQGYVPVTGGPPDGSKILATGYWYDDRNHIIKQTSPGSAARKNSYDGAGRLIATFATNAADNTTVPGSDAPDNVVSDIVLEETHYTYDADGNVTLTLRQQRYAGATDDDALGGPSASFGTAKSRDYYTASYYDSLNRLTRSINVGTNGGSAYTSYFADATASRSNDKLITDYQYDDAGRLWRMTNPRNIDSVTYYDLLGRKTKTIDGRKDFDSGSGTDYGVRDSNNRTTTYTYNGAGNMLSLRALTPDGSDTDTLGGYQETLYVYGVGASSGSDIESNDLLREVRYPTKTVSSGNLDAFAADGGETDAYAYNTLGEKVDYIDRRGVEHGYTYDVVGRMTADSVYDFGASGTVDQSVSDIIYSYDSAGRRYQVTSYDSTAAIMSRVQDVYNGFGQLVTEYQSHGGSVNTSTTPKVQYSYSEDGTNNHSRPTSVTYPNGRTINYAYASGLDNTISRLSSISDGATELESYAYLGLGTFVTLDRDEANSSLTYGDDTNAYAGLDRFGRIVDQKWQSNDSTPTVLDETQYSYDRNGNRIKANVATPGAPTSGADQIDQMFSYDDLDRLVEARRGTIDTSGTWKMTSVRSLNAWGLDTLGNVTAYLSVTDPTFGDANLDGDVDFDDYVLAAQNYGEDHDLWTDADFNGDGVVGADDLAYADDNYGFTGGNAQTSDTRTYNGQNELETMGSSTLAYDSSGNQITDQNGYATTYDAWNRPTEVKNGSTLLTSYSYDGLGRRITEGLSGSVVHNYYNSGWQLVEARLNTGGTANESFVWSPVYIDALITRDRDADNSTLSGSNGLEERVYSEWDANFNVTSLVGDSSASSGYQPGVIERYRYEPYGERTVLNADFASDTLAGSDSTTGDDSVAAWNKSDVLFLNGHQGGMYDRHLEGQLRVRFRTLDVAQMRWSEVDPAGFIESLNPYQYELSNPIDYVDILGLSTSYPPYIPGPAFPPTPPSGIGMWPPDFGDSLFPSQASNQCKKKCVLLSYGGNDKKQHYWPLFPGRYTSDVAGDAADYVYVDGTWYKVDGGTRAIITDGPSGAVVTPGTAIPGDTPGAPAIGTKTGNWWPQLAGPVDKEAATSYCLCNTSGQPYAAFQSCLNDLSGKKGTKYPVPSNINTGPTGPTTRPTTMPSGK